MQLQDTDWQTSMAARRIGDPSSWTPVAARFGNGDPIYGVLYYSPRGCYFIPDGATQANPQGVQSLMWGPGLEASMVGEAGDAGGHAVVDMAGVQMSIAADHGTALVRLANEASGPAPSPIPAQPTGAQTDPHYQGPPAPQAPAGPQAPATSQPAPPAGYVAAPGPQTAAMPAAQHPGMQPTGAQPPAAQAAEVEKSGGGTRQRILIYILIAVVVLGGGYAAYTFLLS